MKKNGSGLLLDYGDGKILRKLAPRFPASMLWFHL